MKALWGAWSQIRRASISSALFLKTSAALEPGKEVVAQAGCLACHKLGDNGNDGPGPELTEIGAAFGMSECAVKVAVHRLRQSYGAALRAEISETVETAAEVDAELRHLLDALGP